MGSNPQVQDLPESVHAECIADLALEACAIVVEPEVDNIMAEVEWHLTGAGYKGGVVEDLDLGAQLDDLGVSSESLSSVLLGASMMRDPYTVRTEDDITNRLSSRTGTCR